MSVGSTNQADILSRPAPPADQRFAYGREPSQFGELRLPPGDGPHPVLIVVHGGFWRSAYSLEHIGHLCTALGVRGVATWSLEYRRTGEPGGGWPGTLHDVAAGADHVRRLAASYPLDLGRLAAIGHSAGGHLALWLAAHAHTPHAADGAPAVDVRPRGVVSLAGVADLRGAAEQRLGRGAVQAFMGCEPADDEARYRAASPLERLPLGCRQVLVHGTADDAVPIEQSERYAAAAAAHGEPVRLVRLPQTGHFELIDPSSHAWPAVLAAAEGALGA